ncbi:MAG: metal-dependent transcriptional regulator [Candidatus Eisenbacteria bacterium]
MKRAAASALTRSRQDYVKALFDLDSGEPVSVSAIARHLEVSPPSVTNMLARLEAEKLVALHHRGAARLTHEGEREALRVVRRHRILEAFLVRVLGLDSSVVHEDAEVLEHHVSDRVLDAIDRLMEHPSEDPHGHLIPDRFGRLPRRVLIPLADLPVGRRAVVREIHDRNARRMQRWQRAGLIPGAQVRMHAVHDDGEVLEVEVQGQRMVTGSGTLEGVFIEALNPGARK